MHTFKLDALTPVHSRGKRFSRWTNYIIKASNPFDAINKLHVKYPGRLPAIVHEMRNDRSIRHWTIDKLNSCRAEIMIEFDVNS